MCPVEGQPELADLDFVAGLKNVGVVTWDMKEDRILGRMNLPARPDHVSMSPSDVAGVK